MKKSIVVTLSLLFVLLFSKDFSNGDLQCFVEKNSYKEIFTYENHFDRSDLKWKTNVVTLENSLQKVSNLRGVSFDWKTEEFPNMKFDKGHQIGFIAQEVESIIPEIVKTEDKGFKSVDYGKVTPLLVEAIKEQQKQINEQKNVVDRLQKENSKLKNDFELLKEKIEKLVMEKKSPIKQPAAADAGGARKNIEE